MLDSISISVGVAMFALAYLYVVGCDRLKGTRP